jgi:hypothetical protein
MVQLAPFGPGAFSLASTRRLQNFACPSPARKT